MTEHTFMIVVAIVIGLLAGFGAIAIRAMIKFIGSTCFPGPGNLLDNIIAAPWTVKLGVPTLGGLIVGPLIYFFAKEAKGHGVPEVMQAILLRGGKIRPRVAVIKALASAITIGTGGSVGREGPIIQIGSSIGSTVGQFLRISGQRLKTFVGCGAAAGIAAAFNAPIAGALFAVEIILQDFAVAQFSPIVIASVMATVVSHHFEGNFAAFQVPKYELSSPYELVFYLVLAFMAAGAGYLFQRSLYFSESLFDERFRFPEYLKPMVGGFLVGLIALIFPQIMGVGYETINLALHGQLLWKLALLLVFVKLLATSITLGSGGSGGIFAPSLFLGAMVGVFFGGLVHGFFPLITSSPGAYALVAMGGVVAATTHAPITAIIIVFELTNDYRIILPLMITCIVSNIVASKLSRESIYTLKLLRRNIMLKDGAETNIMQSLFVRDVVTPSSEIISEDMKFDEVVSRVIASKEDCVPVLSRDDVLMGVISIHDVKEYLYDIEFLKDVLIARDIVNRSVKPVLLTDHCQTALDQLATTGHAGTPVLDASRRHRLVGMIWHRDILDAYNREVEARDAASLLASRLAMSTEEQQVHFMEGYQLAEMRVPQVFVGKSIRELDIRARYGVDVLLIKKASDPKKRCMPKPEDRFHENDRIVVAGEFGRINLIKEL